MMLARLLSTLLILCIMDTCYAQDKFVSTQLAVGHLNQLDTYLSNEKYYGTEWRFISEVMRDSRKHPLTYILTHEGAFANTHNRADNANELSGHYDFAYSVTRRFHLSVSEATHLNLYAGLFANADLGFCYNTRNSSNNPAQGYASANIGVHVMARYCFPLWHKTMSIAYEARTPFVGLMFSPNYGQSYYEIFKQGVYDHNAVVTSISTFQLRQQFSLDVSLTPKTALRIGYLGDIRQSTPNNLKQHQWYNAVILGVTRTL
ncbi:MAG: DUF3316 domain-containing protein [Prevotella sp.]|nr:DUF3316 domain-containing protein [Prevotella sp.]MBR1840402.1 DUF3316 domain-containing protein [Prevotella sp.]